MVTIYYVSEISFLLATYSELKETIEHLFSELNAFETESNLLEI